MNEDLLKMIKRIKTSPDGPEFMAYLERLSKQNYHAFKMDETANNNVHKGYAIAIDSLLDTFAACEELLEKTAYKMEKERLDAHAFN